MQKPDKLYSYADFQDDLRNAVDNCTLVKINTDGYMVDPKTHKKIMRLMAGPGGAEINGNRMHGGDLTGQYVVDGPAADTISYSYNFHKFTPKQMHEMDPYNSIGLTQGITTYV